MKNALLIFLVLISSSALAAEKAKIVQNVPDDSCLNFKSTESKVDVADLSANALELEAVFEAEVKNQVCEVTVNGVKLYSKTSENKNFSVHMVLTDVTTAFDVVVKSATGEEKMNAVSVSYVDYRKQFDQLGNRTKRPWKWGTIRPYLGFAIYAFNQENVDLYRGVGLVLGVDYWASPLFFERDSLKFNFASTGFPPLTRQSVFNQSGIAASTFDIHLAYGRKLLPRWKDWTLAWHLGAFFADSTVTSNVFGYRSLFWPEGTLSATYGLNPLNRLVFDLRYAVGNEGLISFRTQSNAIELRAGVIRPLNEKWTLDARASYRILTFSTNVGTIQTGTFSLTGGVDLTF